MIMDPEVVLLRIGLAVVLGALVGIEREWRHKAAGIKTNTLVAIGSTSFALMTNTFGPQNHNPAQLAAAVVAGIGFIGAGVIIHRGASVQGVTTAATLWANASMGVAVGLGYYATGGMTFLGIVFVQFAMRRAENAIGSRRLEEHEIEIRVDAAPAALPAVTHAWTEFASSRGIIARQLTVVRAGDDIVWRAVFVSAPSIGLDLTTIEGKLVDVAGVRRIEARQTTPPGTDHA
jgi:putative Mg2+ transporter-C (MgtC) family protein